MDNFLVFNVEYAVDAEGNAQYEALRAVQSGHEREYAGHWSAQPTPWVFKRPVCISWLRVEGANGHLAPGNLETAGMPAMEEAELLTRFFAALSELPSEVKLASWGGSTYDLPSLRLTAMRRGMGVPRQLSGSLQGRKGAGSGHIDLMALVCGDAPPVQLSEICAAFRIPGVYAAGPAMGASPVERGEWSQVQSACENAVLSTAALLAHVMCNRTRGLELYWALLGIARLGAGRSHRPYSDTFRAWVNTLVREESARCFEDLLAGKL